MLTVLLNQFDAGTAHNHAIGNLGDSGSLPGCADAKPDGRVQNIYRCRACYGIIWSNSSFLRSVEEAD
jgi:hypothetical protein